MRRKVQVRFCEGESGDPAMDDRSLLYGLEDESRRQLIPRGGDMILLKGVVIVPTLETKRLQLIPFTLDLKEAAMNDRARLVEMLGVYVPEHWPGPDLAEALPFFVENMEKAPSEPAWDWIAIHRLDLGVIGGIGFMGGPDKDGVVEMGYDIVPEYRKQGYATEMARSLVAWAFQEAGIKVVTASCLDDNIGSIKVLENAGMRRLEPDGNMLKWEIRQDNQALFTL